MKAYHVCLSLTATTATAVMEEDKTEQSSGADIESRPDQRCAAEVFPQVERHTATDVQEEELGEVADVALWRLHHKAGFRV